MSLFNKFFGLKTTKAERHDVPKFTFQSKVNSSSALDSKSVGVYRSGNVIANRYEVVQGPGEKPSLAGGMGLVYLCVDHAENGLPVALKTFRPEFLSNRNARDRFLREGTTWVQLGKHPHVVRCHQVIKADIEPEVFCALELVAATEGKRDASLRSWLTSGKPLSVEQSLLFALHIARGMKHATKKISGLVHRDLKPENVLVGSDGNARVTDFGLVNVIQYVDSNLQIPSGKDKKKTAKRTKLTRGIVGTPQYMAPEQWANDSIDERTDIYAFGCILYEMLVGSFMINLRNIKELERAHKQGIASKARFPQNLPCEVVAFVKHCLAQMIEARPANWEEVEDVLEKHYNATTGKNLSSEMEIGQDTRDEKLKAGWSFNAIGMSYYEISKFMVAVNYHERALVIGRTEEDQRLIAAAFCNIGNAYLQLGEFKRAIEYHEKHLSLARKISDRRGEGTALGNLGNAYRESGDAIHSIELYNQHLDISKEIGDWLGYASALCNLGTAYRRLGDFHRAIDLYEQSLDITRQISDRLGQGIVLGNLGNTYSQLGQVRKSIGFHEQRYNIAQEIGDRYGEGQALSNLGNAYLQIGDPNHALKLYEKRLKIANEVGDKKGEGYVLGNIGNAYLKLGDVHRSIQFHKQCLDIMREIGDRYGEGQALGNLGIAYKQLGDITRAIEKYEEQLIIAREIKDRHGEGTALGSLGAVYIEVDKVQRGIDYLKQHLNIAQAIGDRQGQWHSLRNLGFAYVQLNEVAKAIEFYEPCVTIAREIGDMIGAARDSVILAVLLPKKGRLLEALDYAKFAEQVFIQAGRIRHAQEAQRLVTKIHSQLR